MRRYATIAGAALLLFAAGAAVGWYAAPTKVRTETKVETREVAKVEYRDRVVTVRGPERVRTITIEKPGGERVIERVVERGPSTTTTDTTGQASATTASSAATATVTERGRPAWSLGLAATWAGRPSSLPDRLGLELDRRLLGPLWLGARASISTTLSEPQFGAALRVEW